MRIRRLEALQAQRSAPPRRRARRCAFAAAAPRISTARPLAGDVLDTQVLRRHRRLRSDRARASRRAPARRSPRSRARCARAGQMLAFEPPHFGAGGDARRRVASGSVRARGARTRARCATSCSACASLDGTGEDLAFGGRVMKNVAGFDVSRLMTGALGTLGVLTEVSLKCLPLPEGARRRASFECSADEAIRTRQRVGRPAAAAVGDLLPRRAGCACGCPARPPAVAAAAREDRRRARVADADAFWAGVRDQTHAFFAAARARRRAAVAAVGASRPRRTRTSAASS